MGLCVCGGAMLQCPFGTAPSSLTVLPDNQVLTSAPIATIMDYKPFVNIASFGMCNSPANPATKRPPPVNFTPAPCVPNTTSPWMPGCPTVLIANFPALNNASILVCIWGGVITITNPGQTTIMIP